VALVLATHNHELAARTDRVLEVRDGTLHERFTGNLTMLCENCGEKDASIHYTQIEKNEMHTFTSVQECAAEKGCSPASTSATSR
jgi:ABC-type lipoprotein export system ATPase subunit